MHDPGIVAVFSGGGTGGHLYPALALAGAMERIDPSVRPFFVGARRGIEARVLPERGVEHLLLPVEGFRRGRGWRSWRAVPALVAAVARVGVLYARLRPGVVVVTGGYAGAPAGIAAVLAGVPLVLQEQNAVPGITTRGLSPWARQVHIAFPEAAERLPSRVRGRVRVTGNPIQPPNAVDGIVARARFGLPEDATVVLAVGGSQGSEALNRVLAEAVTAVEAGAVSRPRGLHLLWSTGPRHIEAVRTALGGGGAPAWVHILPYIDDMPSALAAADLAVSRAGAMATSELLAWGVPAILVPLPTSAAGHQARNAEALARAGAAVALDEAGLTGGSLWAEITRVAGDSGVRDAMRRAALERARPEAARRIARDVLGLLGRGSTGGGDA